MKLTRTATQRFLALLLTALCVPQTTWGCAVCYGASDAPMTKGMSMGILTLLGVVGCIWAAFLAFFVYLGKKSAGAGSAPKTTDHAADTSSKEDWEESKPQPQAKKRFTIP